VFFVRNVNKSSFLKKILFFWVNKRALERLGRQGTFKFRALWSVREGKGLNMRLPEDGVDVRRNASENVM
jgi:hypothetical protein